MTVRAPRLWEYHNELVGGTNEAWRSFQNESMDLGQRAYEVATFVHEVAEPEGVHTYISYGFPGAEGLALQLKDYKKVNSLDDQNVEGIWEGYFVYPAADQVPFPETNWDPKVTFRNLVRVRTMGWASVWKGRQQAYLDSSVNEKVASRHRRSSHK
jgi:hypothetical protein